MNKLVLAMACLACASALPLDLDSGSFFPGTGRDFGSGGQFISSGGDIVGSSGNFDSGNFDSGNFDSGNFVSGDSGNFVSGNSGGNFASGSSGSSGSGSGDSSLSEISLDPSCSNGQIKNYNGQCITPEVSKNMFLYAVAPQSIRTNPAKNIPNPKVHLNYVFVRHESNVGSAQPIVVADRQKTIVYVLKKNADDINQQVIEVPHEPTKPEVFVVNYDEGDNRELPGGVNLQQALSQSLQNARVIEASAGSSGSSDGGSDGGFSGNLRSGVGGSFSQGGSSGGSFSSGGSSGSFNSGGSSGSFSSGGSSSGGSFSSGSSSGGRFLRKAPSVKAVKGSVSLGKL